MRKAIIFVLAFFLLLPLAKADTYLTSCAVLDTPGETYYLTADIIDYPGEYVRCMDIRTNDIVLDCQGHLIDGVDAAGSIGIMSDYPKNNITIRNCRLSDWYLAIGFYYLANNTNNTVIEYNNISSCTWGGIQIQGGNNHIVRNNVVDGSGSDNGIRMDNTIDSLVENNEVFNTTYGSYTCCLIGSIGRNTTFRNNYYHDNNFAFVTENNVGYNYINNTLINNKRGFYTKDSNETLIFNNTITTVDFGIYCGGIVNNTKIINNTITPNKYGIITVGYNNYLRNNTFSLVDVYGQMALAISWSNDVAETYSNDIDESNIANGKPIKYFASVSNIQPDLSTYWQVIFANASNVTIQNAELNGLELENVNNSIVRNVTTHARIALLLEFSNNNAIQLTAKSKIQAVSTYVTNNNTFYNSVIQAVLPVSYASYFLTLTNSTDKFYNNLINITGFTISNTTNNWNTTRQTGTRIYSAGTEIGGNYWTNPDGNGYSDTCRDTEGDGFCDSPYVLATDNIDYLPYSKWYGSPTWGAPRWSNNSTFIPSTYDYNTLSVFNITWNDSLGYSIDTVLFESNFSGTPTNYTMTLIDPYINATENKGVYNFNVTLPAGTFYWKSYAKASDGVWNVSDTWYFTINKAIPALTLTAYPSWSIFYPAETNVTGSESNLGDSDLTYNLYRNDVLVSNPDVATLAVGSYVYVYNTSGGQNYTANSVSNTLTVSALPPVHGVPLLSSTLVGIVIGFGIITFMLRTLFDIREPKKVIEYFIVLAVIVLTVLSLIALFA